MPCRRLIIAAFVLAALAAGPGESWAQRVQVPDYGAPPQTFAAPPAAGGATPVYGSPVGPGFDPYATPGMGAPGPGVPYSVAPSAPLGGYPTAPVAPAQPSLAPYGATPYGASPYATPGYAPQAPAGAASTAPFAWEKGTYGYETADGGAVRWQQFLQALAFEHTYMYGNGSSDALGINRLEISSTVAFPLGYNLDAPLLLTPGFAFNWFDGPATVAIGPTPGADLPPRVYDAYLDAAWYPQPSPNIGAELGLRTGVWTDFEEVSSDSVRILGRALAKVRVTPTTEVLIGVVYLDRLRLKLLPAGGVRMRPNELWEFDLVFPNPRIRKRLPSVGTTDWRWVLAGEYGGGSWTIERIGGVGDQFDYNDIRFTTGLQWETAQQVTGHLEVGVAFDRELVYRSAAPARFSLDTTLLIRGGVQF